MNRKVIEDFIAKQIEQGSQYIWMTDRMSYGTMFKTNGDIEKTVDNIVNIVENHLYFHGEDRKENVVNVSDQYWGRLDVDTDRTTYFLFDYTNGVVESV